MAEGQCIAIVAYEVAAEDSERFLEAWEAANGFLQERSGCVSNRLHRAVSANPAFRFVNVATWESEDAFRAATQDGGFRGASGRLEAYPVHASVYEVVRTG